MAAWLPMPGALAPWLDLLAHLPAALWRSFWRERVVVPPRRLAARTLARLALWCATDVAVAVTRPAVTIADLDTMPMPALICPLVLPAPQPQPSPGPAVAAHPVLSGLRPYALQLGYSPHAAPVPATTVVALSRALLTLEHCGLLVDWQLPVVEHILDALLPLAVVADEALAERVAQQPSQVMHIEWLRAGMRALQARQDGDPEVNGDGDGDGDGGKATV